MRNQFLSDKATCKYFQTYELKLSLSLLSQEELKILKLKRQIEKEQVEELQKLANLRIYMIQAEQEKHLVRIADVKIRAIPDLGKQIVETEHRIIEENICQQGQLLTEVFEPDAIAETGLF
jgi:hypothetical protein